MQTIIVATDYSEEAQNALDYAACLARQSNSKIALYNSYRISVHAANGLISPETITKLVQENREKLKQTAARISKKYQIPVEYYTKYCTVEEGLNELAEQIRADMVIMGMRSNRLEYKLFGNTTISVIKNAYFPVLVVPEGATYKNLEKILFACDYHTISENALEILKQLALKFNAELQILHIGTTSLATTDFALKKAVLDEIERALKGLNYSFCEMEEEEDVERGIIKGLREFGADMLLMAHHKKGFWSSIFNKSRTREMALKVEIPLLALEG